MLAQFSSRLRKHGEHFSVPVKVDNDGNAAALAEARGAQDAAIAMFFTRPSAPELAPVLCFDGKIYHGRTGAAAEGGHVSIDYRGPRCACGKHGCIEVLAAGPAIARRARAKVAVDPVRGAALLALANGNVAVITSEMVGQAYAAGDRSRKKSCARPSSC